MSASNPMDRIYLYVAPEEYAEVKAAGGCWDEQSKRWYIRSDKATAEFSRWLGDDEGEAEFGITSDEALVASAQTLCSECHESIEVICIYCESGMDTEMGEAVMRFTVSNVWAIDDALAGQLGRWPYFKKVVGADREGDYFANHCAHCGAVQEEYLLHAEPGDVFFGVSRAEPAGVEFTPLVGRVRVSGDYGFEV
jgi:Domain of unknown function (DUF5710)